MFIRYHQNLNQPTQPPLDFTQFSKRKLHVKVKKPNWDTNGKIKTKQTTGKCQNDPTRKKNSMSHSGDSSNVSTTLALFLSLLDIIMGNYLSLRPLRWTKCLWKIDIVSIELAIKTVGKWKETYQWVPIFGVFAAIATAFSTGANNLPAPVCVLLNCYLLLLTHRTNVVKLTIDFAYIPIFKHKLARMHIDHYYKYCIFYLPPLKMLLNCLSVFLTRRIWCSHPSKGVPNGLRNLCSWSGFCQQQIC